MKPQLPLVLALFLFSWPSIAVFAQQLDFSTIDKHAKEAPRELKNAIADLTNYLIEPAENDLEKTRAIFVWITHNIRYDVEAVAWGGKRPDQKEVQRTLKSRKAVCEGYSVLFKAMCDLAGLKSEVIVGWSKSADGKVSQPGRHAWNVVSVDDQWHPLDLTWGAGGVGRKPGKGKGFFREFKEQYFLSNPTDFVIRHLPADPMWQLLDCPIALKDFKKKESVIRENIKSMTCHFSYRDSIAAWEGLNTADRELKSAFNEDRFHSNFYSKNSIAWAYITKGNYAVEQIGKAKDYNHKYALFKERIRCYELALEAATWSDLKKSLKASLEAFQTDLDTWAKSRMVDLN